MTLKPLRQLLTNRDFMLVWWAGLVSWTGNYTLFVALPVYVYRETNSTLATALSVMANALPAVLVGQVAGVLVDRWNYKRTMLFANFLLALVTLLFLTVLRATWWWVVPVAFLQSSVGQFLGPAENALLPSLVARERLGAANSMNALNNNLARLIGPAVGGILVAGVGFAGVVIVDALSYLVAALLIVAVKESKVDKRTVTKEIRPKETAQKETSPKETLPNDTVPQHPYKRLLAEWREGLTAVRTNRLLEVSFLAAALVGFGEGFISTLMAPFVETLLGGDGAALGYIFSAQALGGIAAGLLLTGFADRVAPVRLLAWGGLLSGLMLVPIFNYPLFYPALWPALALTALAGLPFAAWGTAQMTLLQTETLPEQRGRVFASYFAVFNLLQLAGMAVAGVLGDAVGVLVINVDALTYLLAGIVGLVALRRLKKDEGGRPT